MRTILVGLLVIVCLVAIVIPALLIRPQAEPLRRLPEFGVRRATFTALPIWLRWSPFGARAEGWRGVLSAAASWVYLYLTSMLMLALVPHRTRLITQAIRGGTWTTRLRLLAIGLLALIASVLLVLLARFAFVWVVLVIVLAGAIFVLSYLGLVGVSLIIGGGVRRWAGFRPSPWAEVALGSLVLFAVGHIPVVGWLCIGIVAAIGLGAVLATHLGSGQAWSLREWETAD